MPRSTGCLVEETCAQKHMFFERDNLCPEVHAIRERHAILERKLVPRSKCSLGEETFAQKHRLFGRGNLCPEAHVLRERKLLPRNT